MKFLHYALGLAALFTSLNAACEKDEKVTLLSDVDIGIETPRKESAVRKIELTQTFAYLPAKKEFGNSVTCVTTQCASSFNRFHEKDYQDFSLSTLEESGTTSVSALSFNKNNITISHAAGTRSIIFTQFGHIEHENFDKKSFDIKTKKYVFTASHEFWGILEKHLSDVPTSWREVKNLSSRANRYAIKFIMEKFEKLPKEISQSDAFTSVLGDLCADVLNLIRGSKSKAAQNLALMLLYVAPQETPHPRLFSWVKA